MHVTSPLPRRARLLRLTRRVLIAVCLVVFVECAWFNLPYVLSIGASGDSVSAHNEDVAIGSAFKHVGRGGVSELVPHFQLEIDRYAAVEVVNTLDLSYAPRLIKN